MKIKITTGLTFPDKEKVVVYPIFDADKQSTGNKEVDEFIKNTPSFGKEFETQYFITPTQKILLVGIGKADKLNFEVIQNWAGTATRALLQREKGASFLVPKVDSMAGADIVEALVLGVEIASHNPASLYKSVVKDEVLQTVELSLERAQKEHSEGFRKGQILSEAINLARMLGDMPPNEMTPGYFLGVVRKIALGNKLKLTVIDEKKAAKMGMGAFTAVAQGSEEPSYMIVLEHRGNLRSKDKFGLVGKGVTFDTGGISIKPGGNMHEMKYDMSGAAIVLATISALAKLEIKKNIVAVMAVTENMVGGKSMRPGDILKTYSGKTAEVLNTDAEGRLLLLDAVSLAQKDFGVTKMVDLATLTGAIIVALGDFYTGVFDNNAEFAKELVEVGNQVGEKFWEMPMTPEFDEMIRSDFADITNIGHSGSMPGAAGSITGAKFIEAGVKKITPWIHLDIAGTAWDMKSKPYRGIGATGVGVKTLVKLILER